MNPFKFLADENFNERILRGVARLEPSFDVVRVREVGLLSEDDELVLAWAGNENRILLTHDISTMVTFAWERVAAGLAMPGAFIVPELAPVGLIVDSIAMLFGASTPDDWRDQVAYLPI